MTQQEEIYAQGFIDKCAELGVDPEELIKQARLGATISAGARKAMAMLLNALRKKLPSGAAAILGGAAPRAAIPKAVSATGRFAGGAASVPINLYRSLLGMLHGTPSLAAAPRSLAGRAGEVAGIGGLGLGGLSALLGGGEGAQAEKPKYPSGTMFGPGGVSEDTRKAWEAKGWGPEGNPEIVALVKAMQQPK